MAGDLTGMFKQLNTAIQGFDGMAQPMTDMMSQGVGGMMGAATGQNSMDFMNETAREREGKDQLSKLDLTLPEDMAKGSQVQFKMGNTEQGISMASDARAMQAEQQLRFEKNQEDILKNSARSKAMALAMKRKDRAAHAGLAGGEIEPGTYLTSVHEEGVAIDKEKREQEAEIATYKAQKEIDALYEPAKPASYSAYGKEAEDLGFFPGTPEYNEYVMMRGQGAEGKLKALSPAGKVAQDRGFMPGTPEFQAEVSRLTMAENPRAWNQYQEVMQTIKQDSAYKAADEQFIKANQAETFHALAVGGNTKAIPQLETSLATLLQSSVRAQAEIANIRSSNDVVGRFLDGVSKGITGKLTASTLATYGEAINTVIAAARQDKSTLVNRQVNAARSAGVSDEVLKMTLDSLGVDRNESNWVDR